MGEGTQGPWEAPRTALKDPSLGRGDSPGRTRWIPEFTTQLRARRDQDGAQGGEGGLDNHG